MAELTAVDKQILEMLVEDGRTPAAEISRKLKIPATTIRNRIHRLEKLGVISGYKAVINRKKLGFDIKAIVQVQLESTRDYYDFLEKLFDVDEVVEVFLPTGPTDALATVWIKDVDHLGEFLTKKFNLLPKVIRTNTLIGYVEKEYPPPIKLADKIYTNK